MNNDTVGPHHFENVVELNELLPANRHPQAGSEVINTGRQLAALDPPLPDRTGPGGRNVGAAEVAVAVKPLSESVQTLPIPGTLGPQNVGIPSLRYRRHRDLLSSLAADTGLCALTWLSRGCA